MAAGSAQFEALQQPGKLQYDPAEYDFHSLFRQMFDGFDGNFDQLHAAFPGLMKEYSEHFDANQVCNTKFHRMHYDSAAYPSFVALYHKFCAEILTPLFGEEEYVLFQMAPTFRISLPGNSALGTLAAHNWETLGDYSRSLAEKENEEGLVRVGLHCDGEYGHPSGEINFILPISTMHTTKSVYYESAPEAGDFKPMDLVYGEVFHFYGNACRHHNTINSTVETRVSIDFRAIPMSRYDPEYKVLSLSNAKKFLDGGYFLRNTAMPLEDYSTFGGKLDTGGDEDSKLGRAELAKKEWDASSK